MPQYIKVGGTWTSVDESTSCGSVNVGGSWKTVQGTYVKVDGVWRSVCSSVPEIVLTITNTDSGGQYNVMLDWTFINTTASSVEVYRNGSFLATIPSGTTTYTNNNLACGTTYSYYVKVTGGSLTSNTVSRTTPACPTTTSGTTSGTTSEPGTTGTTSGPTPGTTGTTSGPGPISAYYGAACCDGSVALFSSTQSCTVVSNWFGDNCTTLSNFVCQFGTSYPSTSCPGTTATTGTTAGPTQATTGTTANPCTGCSYYATTQEYICVGGARYLYECDIYVNSCGQECNTNCYDYLVSQCSSACGCGGTPAPTQATTAAPTQATTAAPTTTSSPCSPCCGISYDCFNCFCSGCQVFC